MDQQKQNKTISGFSKLNKRGKIKWIVENFFRDPENVMHELMSYWHRNEDQQKILDGFSENTISNFPMPFSVAPNFLINGKTYCIPMVTEESSVVAAAAAAAKFWMDRGGIKAQVVGTQKLGQIHFRWKGTKAAMLELMPQLRQKLLEDATDLMANMLKRNGGVGSIELKTLPSMPGYYQLLIAFETCDSMGANFINSCLESFAQSMKMFFTSAPNIPQDWRDLDILMSILSNYTPNCLVRAWVDCPIASLGNFPTDIGPEEFAERFSWAVEIAHQDPYRAVTHNKGIFNGIDAVVIATANDFRAIEACGHAYACRDGHYRSLSSCRLDNGHFHFSLELPLALGTVGGLTNVHPIARRSLELLGNPDAKELMMIVAATGLAQNFSALRSLITTGIQQGHMKMHLVNILNHIKATDSEMQAAIEYFKEKKVSFTAVRAFLENIRNKIDGSARIFA